MIFTLRRLPLGPVIKVGFVVYFILSFIGFLLYSMLLMGMINSIGALLGDFDLPSSFVSGPTMILGGLFIAVFLAVLYTIITAVFVLVYNAVASFTGGFELELETPETESMQREIRFLREEVEQLKDPRHPDSSSSSDINRPYNPGSAGDFK